VKLVARSIKDPVTVIVGILLVTLFGSIALFTFPIQLTPNVDLPVITVSTIWPDASPQEVEQEIVKPQEEKLKNVTSLRKMTSQSSRNQGQIRLEFEIGTNLDRARLDVSDMLRQVEEYPPRAKEPVITSSESSEGGAIAWLMLSAVDPQENVARQFEFVDDFVRPVLRRVPGVSDVKVYGGLEREVQVRVDMVALAGRGLTLLELREALNRANINASAGDLAEGKSDFQIRTEGQFNHVGDVEDTVIAQRAGGPIYLRDVAEVVMGYKEPDYIVRHKGQPVMAVPVMRESGANVIAVMQGLRQAVRQVNVNLLEPRGLVLKQAYDETDYIHAAIGLVRSNLIIGGFLAMAVMLVFLQAGRPTLVVAASIPISVIGTFLALSLLGRTLNVVSLAGMAFAIGMVVDNAIVVLENIFRHKQMGKDTFSAAYDGTTEVWGAVLSSTLTTVAVFLPVIFIKEEAGQLFKDIALAVSCGVSISLLVSMTVIPMLSSRIISKDKPDAPGQSGLLGRLFIPMGRKVAAAVVSLVGWILSSLTARLATIVVLTGTAVLGSYLLAPAASYLPTGNRNLVFAFMITPPGYNLSEAQRIGTHIEDRLAPYWQTETGSTQASKLAGPPIKHFFYVNLGDFGFMGAIAKQDKRAAELIPVLRTASGGIPGVMVWPFQPSIFGQGGGGRGNTIDVEISGDDIDQVTQAGLMIMGQIMQNQKLAAMPRPNPPNFMLGGPEIQIQPDRVKAAKLGVSWDQVVLVVSTAIDGAKVGDFVDHGKKIDLVIQAKQGPRHTQDLLTVPIYTARGGVVPLGSLVNYVDTVAQQQINHIEERRSVTLEIEPPAGMELQRAMDIIQQEIIEPMRQSGQLTPALAVNLAGTADKLVQTGEALAGGFLLALVITYLLMSSLFGSFVYPLVIMFSVPLAAVGGFAGLRIVSLFTGQMFDVLTMLGFVMLIGVVVNNAILIVHQALNFMRAGQSADQAIVQSVSSRLRPIFMSALTTIFGLMPLVVVPGSGSGWYRGLGAVIVGGLAVSTIFTVFVVPSLFSLVLNARAILTGTPEQQTDQQR